MFFKTLANSCTAKKRLIEKQNRRERKLEIRNWKFEKKHKS